MERSLSQLTMEKSPSSHLGSLGDETPERMVPESRVLIIMTGMA